jgi:hypothetical protein
MLLNVASTVDVVQDNASLGGERSRLEWQGLALIPDLKEAFVSFRLPVTWFVRADYQLRDVYGGIAFLLEKEAKLWRALRADRDEIGWHPSMYVRQPDGSYLSETRDDVIGRQLMAIHKELATAGHHVQSVRVGEVKGSNEIARALVMSGIRADSSALPGRARSDGSSPFDWLPTPNHPYFPTKADYRVPGGDPIGFLEVPMTTARITAPYDKLPVRRYLCLAYAPSVFRAALIDYLEDVRTSSGREAFLTTIIHPEELLPGKSDHPLYSPGLTTVRENLRCLAELAEASRMEIKGVRVLDLADKFSARSDSLVGSLD